MDYLIIIIYASTLIMFALFERVKKFIWLISLQGFLLFALTFIKLIHIEIFELIFILLETVIVKSIVIPVFLRRMTIQNKLNRLHEVNIPVFFSLLFATLIILGSFMASSFFQLGNIHTRVISIAIASFLFGIYFISVHRNIFSHLIGYLIIENGTFLFSIGFGSKMPLLIGLAVLLDVLIGVLIIGVFVNRVQDKFHSINIDRLSQLKD